MSAVVVEDFDLDGQAVGWEDGFDLVAPLDGDDGFGLFEEFIPADVFELFGFVETIGVDVDELTVLAVFCDEHEGSGADFLWVETQALAQTFDELGFTSSELTRKSDDCRQGEFFDQIAGELAGLFDGLCLYCFYEH